MVLIALLRKPLRESCAKRLSSKMSVTEKFSEREVQAIDIHRAREDVLPRIDLFLFPAETDDLAQEVALEMQIVGFRCRP